MLLAVDSTHIRLVDWEPLMVTVGRLRKVNQGLKLHLRVNVQGRSLHWQDVSPMHVNELVAAVRSQISSSPVVISKRA